MPVTPADVHNVVFKKPPMGKRGYDEDEVDAFLDVVEAELARLIEENNELGASRAAWAPRSGRGTRRLLRRRPWPSRGRTTAACLADAGSGDRDGRPLRQRGQGSRPSRCSPVPRAQPADGQPGDAKSDRTVSEAKMRAHSMIGEASTRAATMERVSRAKAVALGQDAERLHGRP